MPKDPVVTGMPGTNELAEKVAKGLSVAQAVIARGHGTFAGSRTLDEAYVFTSLAEHAYRVIALDRLFDNKKN
ncbi:MAG: L-fuculose phosphate aldolase [Methanoregula sp. PtaU1.Bin051]|nr:MAG: L-fuculose phosphate aldolase [Methanoregula sp. PtaU1.Bin051]